MLLHQPSNQGGNRQVSQNQISNFLCRTLKLKIQSASVGRFLAPDLSEGLASGHLGWKRSFFELGGFCESRVEGVPRSYCFSRKLQAGPNMTPDMTPVCLISRRCSVMASK